MKDKKFENKVFLRLQPGEEVLSRLLQTVEKYNIKSGLISGIGALNRVIIGNFDVKIKQYNKEELEGSFEITSLNGNISRQNGKPYLHVHITLANENMQCLGGHLNSGIVSATCEIIITAFDAEIERFRDDELGLNLWKL